MIPGFPSPYPDELVGSLFARAVRHTGLAPKALIAYLGGPRGGYVSWLLSAPLVELASVSARSPLELLWDHTIFPYSTAFLRRETVVKLEAALLERPMRARWGGVPLVQSVTQGLTHRRYCHLCAKQDLTAFGEAYWHRKHNLPGVYRCAVHGTPLHETQIAVRDGMRLFTPLMPGEVTGYVKHFAAPLGVLADISRRSASALSRPLANEAALREFYRQRLAELGLLRGRQVASHDFAYQLLRLYGHAFLQVCGADFSVAEKSPWPSLAARSLSATSLAPVKHMLVQAYLASTTNTAGPRQWGKPGPKPRNYADLDETLCQRLHADLRKSDGIAGLVPVRAWLSHAGCWGTFRHFQSVLPRTAALVASLRVDMKANDQRQSARAK